MSRSTLVVVALLLLVAALAWLQPWRQSPPPPEPVAAERPAALPTPTPVPEPTVEPPVRPPPARAAAPAPPAEATVRDRDDLAALLKARGLDADRAIAELQAWRERRGFLGPDPMNLTGIDPAESRLAYYSTLDEATLRNLAASGDAAAMQTLAGKRMPEDPFRAIDELGKAAGMGSAAAMLQVSSTLQSLAQVPADEWDLDKEAGPKVLALKRGNADRDLRIDALAWTLAAVRQYGPAVTDAATIAWVESTASGLEADSLALACGQSLAIMADISARGAPRDALPPVFTSAPDAFQRLPCGDTAVPISPPDGMAQCQSNTARDRFGQPVSVWTCRGN